MKILISAAEASSDVHASYLLKAMRKMATAEIDAFGIGGPALRAQGLDIVVDATELLSMGTSEAFGKLPKIKSAFRKMVETARLERPDVAVLVDYPEFHFRLARELRDLGIPAVYYIPPKVWVWREKRIRFLAEAFRKVLTIFPFEVSVYEKSGVRATYVGNPLVEELPMQETRSGARQKLGITGEDLVLVAMPGSRPSELDAHFEVMLEGARIAAQSLNRPICVLIPLAGVSDRVEYEKRLEKWSAANRRVEATVKVRLSQGDAPLCLAAADVGLIKSGTSTLEAALMRCPHIVVYRPSRLTSFLFKYVVRYPGPVGLSNLAASEDPRSAERVFPEVLMEQVGAKRLADEVIRIVRDDDVRGRMEAACEKIRQTLGETKGGGSPSERAAHEVLDVIYHGEAVERAHPGWLSARLVKLGSWLWSFTNAIHRGTKRWFGVRPHRLESKVISVGNLQVGGAGKTPLVGWLAKQATESGRTVAILTRGYRSEWEGEGGILAPGERVVSTLKSGDEAALLHDLAPEAWIGVGADRLESYEAIVKKLGRSPDLVILDDGFQNTRIEKDFDLLLVTSQGRDQVLYRDFSYQAKKADLVIWSKGEVPPRLGEMKMFRMGFELSSPPSENKQIWLVTGVADGEHVSRTAKQAGYVVREHTRFPDHASYPSGWIQGAIYRARRRGIKVAVTGKDWVKWREAIDHDDRTEVVVLEPGLRIDAPEGQETFWKTRLWDKLFS